MNTRIYLAIFTLFCAFSAQVYANETQTPYRASDNKSFMEEIFGENGDNNDDGFRYHFAGDAEEEGALKLFVKNTANQHDLTDPTADSLSKISPAAGIQLNFEF